MAPLAEPPGDLAPLFAIERARLLDLVAAIDDADWGRATACPEWTVLDLSCHLVGDDLSLLARHRDGHQGTPPPGGLGEAAFVGWLDELQADWVLAARRLSPRLVVDLLAWAGPQLVEMFAAQDPRARSAHVSWAGPDLVPVWLDQVRELSEYWIHRQQLRQALGSPSDLRPGLAGPILDGLRWALPFRLSPLEAQTGDTVSIEITGPVHTNWQLVFTDVGWDFHSRPGPRVVARGSMSTEQVWRLLTNNLEPDDQAGLQLSGDQGIVEAIRRTRAIIGSPK